MLNTDSTLGHQGIEGEHSMGHVRIVELSAGPVILTMLEVSLHQSLEEPPSVIMQRIVISCHQVSLREMLKNFVRSVDRRSQRILSV